ncbi:hypothetical protein AGLY_001645, partial [Aphis glycines]
ITRCLDKELNNSRAICRHGKSVVLLNFSSVAVRGKCSFSIILNKQYKICHKLTFLVLNVGDPNVGKAVEYSFSKLLLVFIILVPISDCIVYKYEYILIIIWMIIPTINMMKFVRKFSHTSRKTSWVTYIPYGVPFCNDYDSSALPIDSIIALQRFRCLEGKGHTTDTTLPDFLKLHKYFCCDILI